ncbi:hypothetical protein K437DRAFT_85948 [Tilletiaria anomala UBC 951]|uniref:Uncharacterized protein n=1 Tax=Tilletiaria anomala (strain ATCC 24038 / CBS 436.72 / UBC 951) TaxID=1037660 RepID=A0A066WBJ4_TILAU|nr:uncharacterized protein K437DRAFT_85948 [Tilletiaria anomala UBC 951]KDN48454.1 hypothetical protein K437DRAFT_85948 [Tilletiaria anomala UBC 951]
MVEDDNSGAAGMEALGLPSSFSFGGSGPSRSKEHGSGLQQTDAPNARSQPRHERGGGRGSGRGRGGQAQQGVGSRGRGGRVGGRSHSAGQAGPGPRAGEGGGRGRGIGPGNLRYVMKSDLQPSTEPVVYFSPRMLEDPWANVLFKQSGLHKGKGRAEPGGADVGPAQPRRDGQSHSNKAGLPSQAAAFERAATRNEEEIEINLSDLDVDGEGDSVGPREGELDVQSKASGGDGGHVPPWTNERIDAGSDDDIL